MDKKPQGPHASWWTGIDRSAMGGLERKQESVGTRNSGTLFRSFVGSGEEVRGRAGFAGGTEAKRGGGGLGGGGWGGGGGGGGFKQGR